MRPVLHKPLLLAGSIITLAIIFTIRAGNPAFAAWPASPVQSTSGQTQGIVSNETCLECHGQPGLTLTLENGDILDLSLNPDVYAASVHGEGGYACVQCHTTLGEYPHPAFTAADLRDAQLQLYQACQRCHSGEYSRAQDSVHSTALASGVREAAVCTDCHPAHSVRRLTDAQTGEMLPEAHVLVPQICAQCHSAIYQKYRTSVHGSALFGERNSDVPTCIDCHGVHNISNPTTSSFRVNSPLICARCHTDPAIMDQYGISTNVLNTYVSDFHGTTVTLFQQLAPDAETNKPVCYDCHGIHDIQRVDNPETGLLVRENLLARCQSCHPDATPNFPDSWLSHYIPSADKTPLVYYVNLFYKFFIPGTLGGMAALVALDLGSRVRHRIKKTQAEHPAPPAPVSAPADPAQTPGEEAKHD